MDKKVEEVLEVLREVGASVKETTSTDNAVIVKLENFGKVVIPLNYYSKALLKKALMKLLKGR